MPLLWVRTCLFTLEIRSLNTLKYEKRINVCTMCPKTGAHYKLNLASP